jgi:hypothetical protein
MRAPHSYFSAARQDHPEMRSSVQKADDRMAGDCSLRCLGGMTALGQKQTPPLTVDNRDYRTLNRGGFLGFLPAFGLFDS